MFDKTTNWGYNIEVEYDESKSSPQELIRRRMKKIESEVGKLQKKSKNLKIPRGPKNHLTHFIPRDEDKGRSTFSKMRQTNALMSYQYFKRKGYDLQKLYREYNKEGINNPEQYFLQLEVKWKENGYL